MNNWRHVVVTPKTSLAETIAKVDASGLQVALVLDSNDFLLGILTDGNIRRAILDGKNLHDPVLNVMTKSPISISALASRNEMVALMRLKSFHHLPLLNENNQVVGLATLDELIGVVEKPNWVILMAGGLGKRLHPLTIDCPKPMLSVAGKPILESILERFSEHGFKRIFLSVNYKAEMIKNHFGSGERLGVRIEYLHENIPLGTAGALTLLPEKPEFPFIVMNADLLTQINFDNLLNFHELHNAHATMVIRECDIQVPYGVVSVEGTEIKAIEEKPVQKFFVNAGIYALSPAVLPYLPSNVFFDMPTLFERLIGDKKSVAAYPLREYWLDIGRLEEFERAQTEWHSQSP